MDFIFRLAEEFLKKHKRLNRYRRVFAVIAAVVVFATTYELILPAITMDKRRAADTPGVEVGVAADSFEEEAAENESGESVEEENAGEESEETPEAESADPADTDADSGNGSDGSGNAADTDAASGHSTAGNAGTDLEASEGHSEEAGQEAGASDDANVKAEDAGHADTADTGSSDQTDASADKNGKTTETVDNGSTSEAVDPADAAATTDPSLIAPGEPIVNYPATLVFEGKDYTITATFDETAGLPADVRLDAVEILPDVIYKDENGNPLYSTYEEYYEKAVKAVEKEKKLEEQGQTVTTARFFDITFLDNTGLPVEPKAPVSIAVKYKDALSAVDTADTMAVHFDVDKKKSTIEEPAVKVTDVIDTKTDVKKEEIQEISFDAEKFSVYGIVGTETIVVDYLTADGETYTVSADIPEDAGIPAGSELVVEEIVKGTEAYDQYVAQIAEFFGNEKAPADLTFAHLFDIGIYKGTEKIQPKKEVKVKIEFRAGQTLSETSRVSTVHFAETGTEVIYPETVVNNDQLEAVTFDAQGFSVYAIVGMSVNGHFLTADGKTLNVSATFDSREVLPEGAVLDISEVTYEDDAEAYAKRNERLADALFKEYGNVVITDVRYLNITIKIPEKNTLSSPQTWKEYEPVYPVEVTVDYTEPMDITNPGEYTDYNDGSKQFIPDIGNHIVGVHYTEDGAEILETVDEVTDAAVSKTVTHTDGFSEYDFAYIYQYEIKDTDYDYVPSSIEVTPPKPERMMKAAKNGLLRGAGDVPAHTKTLGDNNDGTNKLSLTVTGDADTDSKTASNANIIIVFDTSNSMVNYKVPIKYGTHGSDNDGQTVFQLYSNTSGSGTPVTEGYTGTVYRRSGSGTRYRFSEYTGQRYSSNIRRADAAEKVIHDFAHALYAYQNDDDPSTPEVDESKNIQTALITFNRTAKTTQGWTSTESDITGKVSSTGAANSKKLGNSSGTNWEGALKAAKAMIETADNDPTFVVFITDGQPTQVDSTPSGTYITDGTPYVGARDDAYDVQQACAATGTDSHGALFGIYAYGTEADYLDDMMYFAYNNAVHTADLEEAGEETFETEGYYNAGDSEALAAAINDIFSKIVKTLGITAVSVSDGTTSQVQTTSGEISHLLEVDTNSYEYWLSINTVNNKFTMKDLVTGTDVEYTVSSSGGNVAISWTKDGTIYSETYEGTFSAGTARIKWDRATSFYNYAPPAATFTDPRVDWDLSTVGTLLDGVTYEVTFDVYPSQYTLDLVVDLKNEYVDYDDLDANVKQYLTKSGNDYVLATNTNATISYTDTRTDDGPQTTGYTNPEPVSTSGADTIAITKDWSNDVDGRTKPKELVMHVTRDDTDRYELVLNDADHWQDSSYISFGIVTIHNGVISVKTPGHDFSFSEPPEMEYYWELVAPIIHPMKINGIDTMLVKVNEDEAPSMSGDNATAVGADGYTYYKLTINGTAMYYKVDNSVASLHAENYRRSYLQVEKTVQDPKEGDTFDFTATVTNSNAVSGKEEDPDSDYWVWFSVYDTINDTTVISDDLVSGTDVNRETDASGYTGYYYVPSGNKITVKMQNGYRLRFLNLPTGSTYSISETLDGNYESFSITGQRKYKEETEGEGGSTSVVDKSEDTGTVDGLGISGTIDYADSRYEIGYTNKRIVTEVSAKKEWQNADGTATAPAGASVVYKLYADGEATNYTVTLDGAADEEPTEIGGYESEGWTATFVNQPKYKVVNGEKVEIVYTIGETTTYPGYTASTTEPVAAGGSITNTQDPTTASAFKAWKNADGTTNAPEGGQVTFTLYADGTATSYIVTLDGTADTVPTGTAGYENEAWKAMFQNLPKYKVVNGEAVAIVYTIAETTTYPGYTPSTTDPVASGETITNTQGSTETFAVKAWKNADGSETAPEGATVVFTLFADGVETNYNVTLNGTSDTVPSTTGGYESEAWKATFVKLPKSKIVDGVAVDIVYSIAETTTYPGYIASTTQPVGPGSTITNSQDPATANALKAWVNADGTNTAPQGGKVTYTLYADGVETEYTVTLDGTPETAPEVTGGYESAAWKAEFVNLPKYKTGTTTEIVYTIAETTTYPGYTTSTTDPVASGETITNTQEPTEANALKAWKNADGSTNAPEGATVVFTLYADGNATEYTVTLNGTPEETAPTVTGGYESEAWKAVFVKLPKYKVVEGEAIEIVYTIGETTPYPGYTATPVEPVASGGTITNTQDAISVNATKAWMNADGSSTAPEGASVVFTLYTDGNKTEKTVTLDGTVDENGEAAAWMATFSSLPKYKVVDGEAVEIQYTIGETGTWIGYELVIDEQHPHPVSNGGTITNKQMVQKVQFVKEDAANTSTKLSGAVFTFSIGNNNYTVTSGADGLMKTADGTSAFELPVTSTPYEMTETTAPDGYNKLTGNVLVTSSINGISAGRSDDSVVSYTVDRPTDDNPNYVVHITNTSGVALPMTGGAGTLPYTLGGLMLIIASALMYGFKKRRREGRFN